MSDQLSLDRLSPVEWEAINAALAQLEVNWLEEGTLAQRKMYIKFDRAIQNLRRARPLGTRCPLGDDDR